MKNVKMSKELNENDKRKRNNLLSQYYGITEEKDVENLFDVDGKHFNADAYVDKLVQETSLKQLIDKEQELVREIQSLDSEMQTLVYENYNKFILATDTIRQMKSDFKTMEDEMEKLVQDMSHIATFANNISSNLQDRRQQITKLSNIHELLKNLQFLFDLPNKLKTCVEEKNYSLAVKYYAKSEQVLQDFGDHPSFSGIQSDCKEIVETLRKCLKVQFSRAEVTSQELEESASLLCKLGESSTDLAREFLEINKVRLEKDLEDLSSYVWSGENNGEVVLIFIEKCCNTALNNVALTIATFNNIFPSTISKHNEGMNSMATDVINQLCPIVESKIVEIIGFEISEACCLSVVAALDKFHRRLLAVQRLLLVDKQWSFTLITEIARIISHRTADALVIKWTSELQGWRDSWNNDNQPHGSVKFIEGALVEHIHRAFVALTAFVGNHVTFSQDSQFRQTFGRRYVREEVLVQSLSKLSTMLANLSNVTGKDSASPTLILVLSRVAIDFSQNLAQSLLSLIEEQFDIPVGFQGDHLTPISVITLDFKQTSQSLLQSYVQSESHVLVQMIRKSMDSRDWLTASEPRGVRPVIKRVLEEISRVDSHAAQLYEEGSRKERSSDSSRRTHHSSRMQQKSSWSSLGPSQLDSSLLNNIQKLFSERIDLSGTVEPNKGSVVMAIIKICLKGFLECVRLKTFGKYGIQQIQVDCYYLQLFLWRFTFDENLVHSLLDEILSSAVQRCLEPVLMEPGVVELICER
ncbi:vacuolar protein sorting-associated protein 51 homolog isoform X3 [Daphnia pulex]|uniref:vacuolar protein sorting-associated protein 51 homolog isoform X3 n=1 Tax=Daphnia pulex TaxID=6669 RepID=UPI001EE0C067|nr:vacuolar protein sorting-associated protein 51 homolog isoform X3 [Daphnia pulex]